MKKRVPFVCAHNGARSQMAEALLEEGIDIRAKQTHSVLDFHWEGRRYDFVIAVCRAEAAERCPVFQGPGPTKPLHWPFEDPSQTAGTHEEKLRKVREILDQIRAQVQRFVAEQSPGQDSHA